MLKLILVYYPHEALFYKNIREQKQVDFLRDFKIVWKDKNSHRALNCQEYSDFLLEVAAGGGRQHSNWAGSWYIYILISFNNSSYIWWFFGMPARVRMRVQFGGPYWEFYEYLMRKIDLKYCSK